MCFVMSVLSSMCFVLSLYHSNTTVNGTGFFILIKAIKRKASNSYSSG